MPGRFTNTSGNSVSRFRVVTGNGRGNFYFATPTTTTTSTTTTTTTGVQVWYTLERCHDLVINYSINYNAGTFAINDIVSYGTGGSIIYFRVTAVNSSNPGGTQWSVSATGLPSCPTTTTTTTTTTIAPVTFTAVASCNGTTAQIVVNNFAGGNGLYSWIASGSFESTALQAVNGSSGIRYSLVGLTSYTFTDLAVNTNFYIAISDSNGIDSAAVLVTTPAACTTTTTTTAPPPPPPTYRLYNVTYCIGGTGQVLSSGLLAADSTTVYKIDGQSSNCFVVNSQDSFTTGTPITYISASGGCFDGGCIQL